MPSIAPISGLQIVPAGSGPQSVPGHTGSYSSKGAPSDLLSEEDSQDDDSSSSCLILFECSAFLLAWGWELGVQKANGSNNDTR